MIRSWAVLLAAGLVASMSGCGGGSPAPAGKLRIGAVLPTFGHPFFVAQKRGLEEEAARLGIAIDVRDGQDSDERGIAQVEALIATGCAGVLLNPRDEKALLPAVERANEAKVPILTFNRRVDGGIVVSHIGADDAAGGHAQAEELVRALGPGGGAIVYLQGTAGSSPQRSRQAGFLAVLKGHLEITIADDKFADFQPDRAKVVMTELGSKYEPGRIRAIVAQSDEMALAAAEVVRELHWDGVVVIGFDGTGAALEAVRAGAIRGTVLQDAAEQGRLAVRAMVDHLAGKPVGPLILTPLPLVTRDNVAGQKPGY